MNSKIKELDLRFYDLSDGSAVQVIVKKINEIIHVTNSNAEECMKYINQILAGESS